MNKTILIVAAHPDDEVLGCFGTVARFIQEGYEAYTLILGEGKTSRSKHSHQEIITLHQEIEKANSVIGIKKVFIQSLPDNRFDTVALLDIVRIIENVIDQIKPSIIFTHYAHDLNVDHQRTYQAVITASRPTLYQNICEIYSFEILSSTHWQYPLDFSPNAFFDITNTIELKLNAMKEYQSELCIYPHPRSLEGINLLARYHGMNNGKNSVEAFKIVRMLK